MTRQEFERQMARLRARIADLPPARREALEEMARETLTRHEEIRHASLLGVRAAERLELAFERLGEACRRLAELANGARQPLERSPAHPDTGLGLN